MRLSLTVAAIAALLSLPALGHHGWGGNEGEIEVTGVVETGLSLSGPHGTMQIRDGEGMVWQVTLAPAPRTHRAGLREGTVPVGAEVTVHGERNADPDVYELKTRRVTYGDTHYDVYPPPRR